MLVFTIATDRPGEGSAGWMAAFIKTYFSKAHPAFFHREIL